MGLVSKRFAEARGDMPRNELARRLARRDPYHLGTTSAQQLHRWERGQRPRYESETVAAIAAETGRPVSFFYDYAEPDDDEDEPTLAADLARQLADLLAPALVSMMARR